MEQTRLERLRMTRLERLRRDVNNPCVFAIIQTVIDHIGTRVQIDQSIHSVSKYQDLEGNDKIYCGYTCEGVQAGVTVFADGSDAVVDICPHDIGESYAQDMARRTRIRLIQSLPWLGEEDLYDLITEYTRF